jgi:SWI/SNF-related matrix-associated actin-dependent regulator 1 of chromatin subfamily A
MTELQKSIYTNTLQRSRTAILEIQNGTDVPGKSTTNGQSRPMKKTRTVTKAKEKQYLENSTNVLMDLRKAASHPMLFRKRFTDQTLNGITRQLLKEPDFKKRGALFDIVKEDMEVMTDAELQVFCGSYKVHRDLSCPRLHSELIFDWR